MKDLHPIFTKFKREFPEIHARNEDLGREIHENSGPLSDKIRWLLKIAISAASQHRVALETHIQKGKEAGLTDREISHALLMLIQTVGFPAYMEAYSIYKKSR
jgi:4-carboxymuconolactone decarboxylase